MGSSLVVTSAAAVFAVVGAVLALLFFIEAVPRQVAFGLVGAVALAVIAVGTFLPVPAVGTDSEVTE